MHFTEQWGLFCTGNSTLYLDQLTVRSTEQAYTLFYTEVPLKYYHHKVLQIFLQLSEFN